MILGAVCAELRESCVGTRLSNVYDVSSKVLMLPSQPL